jgi:hypothetical protein
MKIENPNAAQRIHDNPEKDPMSGYASADVIGETAPDENRPADPGAGDQKKDPMSGYASADEIGPDRTTE